MQSFDTHRAEVRPGVELAFWREGVGAPLLLLHGWPETRRIWSRNIGALAAAGFEVVAPDLRGYGDSGLPPDGFYDIAAHARDVNALMVEHLGHRRFAVAGSDLGGGVAIDLGLRFPGSVTQQVLFNCVLPILPDTPPIGARTRQASDYFARQGREADALASELRTPEERRRYVASFYTSRFWGTPGGFTREEVAWMTEPFADAEKLRAGFGNYESAMGRIPLSEPPRLFEPVDVPTLALYGPDDHVIYEDFCERCEASFTDLVGPFIVPRAGHFLQWERAELFNRAVAAFLRRPTGMTPTIAGDG